MSEIQTAAEVVAVEPIGEGNTSQALETFDPNNIAQGSNFVEMFRDHNPGAVAKLYQEAQRVLPAMVNFDSSELTQANMDALANYGMEVLEKVVQTTRQLNALSGKIELPDAEDAQLRKLAVELKKTSQYDMTVQANVERYNKLKAKARSFFGKGRLSTYLEAFKADRKTLEELVNGMRGDLMTQSMHRQKAAIAIKEQVSANRQSLGLMEERAAVLQIIREMVQRERASLPANLSHDDPDAPKARALDMFGRMIDMKITEYAQRWYTGVALEPVYEALWEQNVMMSFKLKVAATTGMEQVETIIATYGQSMDLKSDSDRIASVEKFENDMAQTLFKGAHQVLTTVARQTSSSSMTTETISVIAQEVSGMITDINTIQQQSAAGHETKLKAMQDGVSIIEQAQNLGQSTVDSSKLQSVVQTGRELRSITAG